MLVVCTSGRYDGPQPVRRLLPKRARALLPAVFLLLTLFMPAPAAAAGSVVSAGLGPGGRYSYQVNGQDQLFIGMGYNPIYRNLPFGLRASFYQRDFRLLCQAGVNTITGWDADKGYDQDKFDELTMDTAAAYGLGVVMPIYLPIDGDYDDPNFFGSLLRLATSKVQRFKGHSALRMWGLGNEVLADMPEENQQAFLETYISVADFIHQMDPNHPVIYRDAEDRSVPLLVSLLRASGNMRPWLLYGMNVYNPDPDLILRRWPGYGLNRPLFISEFGPDGVGPRDRGQAYARMWRIIRSHSDFIMGGAPYVWTTAGPEPTDAKWGIMDPNSNPVDDTFARLRQLWQAEPKANRTNCT